MCSYEPNIKKKIIFCTFYQLLSRSDDDKHILIDNLEWNLYY